jgi:class 3 adenylate cyclase
MKNEDDLFKTLKILFLDLGFIKGEMLKEMIRLIIYINKYNTTNAIQHFVEICAFLEKFFKTIGVSRFNFIKYRKKGWIKRLCYFAAICTNIVEHTGVSNDSDDPYKFYIPMDIETDYITHDTSNKEMHVNATFTIFEEFHKCFNLPKHIDAKLFLNNIVLASDVSLHSAIISHINTTTFNKPVDLAKNPITCSIVFMKLATLSHLFKPFEQHSDLISKSYKNKIKFDSLREVVVDSITSIEMYAKPLVSLLKNATSLKSDLNNNKIKLIKYAGENHLPPSLNRSIDASLNIIDRISSFSVSEIICKTHRDACICMIDIVNFSQWCSKQNPVFIFETMTRYNNFLNDKIKNYEDVQKIELVGDSVMIVGGLYADFDEQKLCVNYTKCVFDLCHSILVDLSTLKDIFNDKTISIRIGIHNGDVFSGYIMNPKKFQLFGNSINIASRLESSCLPGALNMSSQTYAIIEKESLMKKIEMGKTNSNFFKGVGMINSKLGFIKTNDILIADDVLSTCKILAYKIKNHRCEIVTSFTECFEMLRITCYRVVLLDRYFHHDDVLSALIEFRMWESKYRSNYQRIVLMTSVESDRNYDYISLYVDEIVDKQNKFYDQINSFISRKRSCDSD